jgi:hypothetical protein
MTEKREILFLSANPIGSPRLRTDVEVREIQGQIASSLDRERFKVRSYSAVRTTDLQRTLLEHPPEIVHFSGHGGEGDGIYLEDELGRAAAVSGVALADLFARFKGTLRIVFLNACESLSTADAFLPFVEYAIVMKRRVTDRTAIVFALAFYRALALGRSCPDAFRLGINQLQIEDLPGVDIPELLEGAVHIMVKPARKKPKRKKPARSQVMSINRSTVRDPRQIQNNSDGKSEG